MSVLTILKRKSFERVHSKAQRSSTLTQRVFRHENTNRTTGIDAIKNAVSRVDVIRSNDADNDTISNALWRTRLNGSKEKWTGEDEGAVMKRVKLRICVGGRYGTDHGEFNTVNTGSIANCSPGKISANVDIRDTRSWVTNDYSAQSSAVKGTECLLAQMRKIECICISWESKNLHLLTVTTSETYMLQKCVKTRGNWMTGVRRNVRYPDFFRHILGGIFKL